jgi:hypothetical protein
LEQSKYGHYSRSSVQRHQRSPSLPGSFEDSGRWYRCWNCRFVYDLNKVGGNPDQDSRYQTEAIYPAYPPTLGGDALLVLIDSDRPEELGTLMELGPDGTPREIYTTRVHHVASGCPSCGTANLP